MYKSQMKWLLAEKKNNDKIAFSGQPLITSFGIEIIFLFTRNGNMFIQETCWEDCCLMTGRNTCRCKGNISASFINIYLAQILGKHMPLLTLIFSWFYLVILKVVFSFLGLLY